MAQADDVLPGFDLFQTDPGTTFHDFAVGPIPADFFFPGSNPFTGKVPLQGEPLLSHPSCPDDDLSFVDTIVKRRTQAALPIIPSSDVIQIEIVALSLRSVSPITVDPGADLWDIKVELSPSPQPIGSMTVTHLNPAGGTFDSSLPVIPQFIFTKVSDTTQVRVFDLGAIPDVINFSTANVPWVHIVPPATSCTSNFCVNPSAVTVELASLANHGLISICPEEPVQTETSTWGRMKSLYR